MADVIEKATFAGGCFWCMVKPFDRYEGVQSVISGYMGGFVENPTYKEVASGKSGHLEVVQISFDPSIISYETLLEIYWRQIDPTDAGGAFADRGEHYTSAIFFHTEQQQRLAEKTKLALAESGKFSAPIVTKIRPATLFYKAEDAHQNYYKKNAIRYELYRQGSGRAGFLDRVWGKAKAIVPKPTKASADNAKAPVPNKKTLKQTLTPIQYHVTQEDGTEPAFQNQYWNNKDHGIYVDVVSGEALFLSVHKFDSGTGWPCFTHSIADLKENPDYKFGMIRTEVRSKKANSHLGHVFNDGPKETGGIRYCINSAALNFIPLNQMEEAGYGAYLSYFESVLNP